MKFNEWIQYRENLDELNDFEIYLEMIDPDTVASAFGGSDDALGTLYGQVFNTAVKMLYPRKLANHADAEDIAGTVAADVVKDVKSGREEDNPKIFPAKVLKMIQNRWKTHLRDTGSHAKVLGNIKKKDSEASDPFDVGARLSPPDPSRSLDIFNQHGDDEELASAIASGSGLQGVLNKEKIETIKKALEMLKQERPDWYDYLLKKYRDNMSAPEISSSSGAPSGSVYGGISKALDKIRNEYIPRISPAYQMDWTIAEVSHYVSVIMG